MSLSILKKYFKRAWAPTLVITIIFFVNYFLFGIENTLIGPFATLSYLRFRNMRHHYGCMIKTFLIYAGMALIAWLALLNLGLNIVMNAAALFMIANYIIDEYNPNNYFPAGMALIFFQISPARGTEILTRWMALFVSFVIIFLFIEITQRRKKTCILEEYAREGLSLSYDLADAVEERNQDKKDNLQKDICSLNRKMSYEIYSDNRAALKFQPDANRYCRFLVCFQTAQYLAQQGDAQGIRKLVAEYEAALEDDTVTTDIRKLKLREAKPDVRRFRFRFALRQVLIVTPCLVFGYLVPEYNSYWMAISVFFMMIPIYENTMKRIIQRVRGSLAGIIICMILFAIFKSFWARVVLMTIFNFLIYCVDSYAFMVTYITGSALSLNLLEPSVPLMMLQRIGYTLVGAGIAFLANKYVFPIRVKNEMGYMQKLLEKIRQQMTEIYSSELAPGDVQHRTNSLIVKSYMLIDRIQEYNNTLKEEEKNPELDKNLRNHTLFMAGFLNK
ncbi:FUSC family protein [Parasporobacterium paucivorans]|uniref:Fusaric acid resistance protein-like n=1 Tax=Parasporobacterium paucivorans DSM 15970 TaxID=1122934 RepID=A0A1M6JBJ5_9FIRM|nr:FUSC family protein [Parasporobacterium paucivorans]SHJ43994.1 Fusaric acid resistance protein-like [Parasporobacterium paucivorans DSM 15970]